MAASALPAPPTTASSSSLKVASPWPPDRIVDVRGLQAGLRADTGIVAAPDDGYCRKPVADGARHRDGRGSCGPPSRSPPTRRLGRPRGFARWWIRNPIDIPVDDPRSILPSSEADKLRTASGKRALRRDVMVGLTRRTCFCASRQYLGRNQPAREEHFNRPAIIVGNGSGSGRGAARSACCGMCASRQFVEELETFDEFVFLRRDPGSGLSGDVVELRPRSSVSGSRNPFATASMTSALPG